MTDACAGRVALVTGASRGIGQAIALRLAADGAKVALVGRAPTTRRHDLTGSLDEGLARVAAVGGTAIALRCDLDDPLSDKAALVAKAADAFGRTPDILVHAAAAPREWGHGWVTPFAEVTAEQFTRSVMTNVWGGWSTAQAVIPGMRAQGGGNIVLISSSAAAPAPVPTPQVHAARMRSTGGASLYGGTKAFLDRICTGAALELYPDNIAVNGLATTGAVVTPQLSSSNDVPPGAVEPMEAFVEAAVALATAEPRTFTGRVVHSLPLLYELRRPVYTLDGAELFGGWQPDDDDARKLRRHYLADSRQPLRNGD